MTRKSKHSSTTDSGISPHVPTKPTLGARFYAFLYKILPDRLSYWMLSSGVPDTQYWGEPGQRRLAGSTSHGGSSI